MNLTGVCVCVFVLAHAVNYWVGAPFDDCVWNIGKRCRHMHVLLGEGYSLVLLPVVCYADFSGLVRFFGQLKHFDWSICQY